MKNSDLEVSLRLFRKADKQFAAIRLALSYLQRGQNLDVVRAIEVLKEAQK